ncbi:MAG TPA: hypothetical protein VJ916_04235 [Anaerovoracaceae bacterium]|nr:hypothetical protein [Anaerovoracaceae bacterium]
MNRNEKKESITVNNVDENDEELIEDDFHYNNLLEIINREREKHHVHEVTEFDIDVIEYSDSIVLNTVNDLERILNNINKLRRELGKKSITELDYDHLSKRFNFEHWEEYLDVLRKINDKQ